MSSSLVIKLIPQQVPAFWSAIKYCCKEADEVDAKNFQPYCNELLQSLLNEKAQCFVRLDEKRTLVGMMITRIMEDKLTGEKYLLIQCLYSWKAQPDSTWREDAEFVRQFKEKTGCKYISFNSRNEAIWELGKKLGFSERTRVFDLRG